MSKKLKGWGYYAGIGGFNGVKSAVLAIPIGLNYLYSKQKYNYFEAAAGIVFLANNDQGSQVAFVPTIGYRYQPTAKGVVFKTYISPWYVDDVFNFGIGIGIGYKLN